jgi:hypothetical protein
VGLPHPEPGNGSVMSLGQYRGWLSESWLDKEQKIRLGWEPGEESQDPEIELFSHFRALPEPPVPTPGERVALKLNWPADALVRSLRVRMQTSIDSPWIDVPQKWEGPAPQSAVLGVFERETPISYRVDTELQNGSTTELWGYFQVRQDPAKPVLPIPRSPDLFHGVTGFDTLRREDHRFLVETDLLVLADPTRCWLVGEWSNKDGKLLSPKRFGARLELPYVPPDEYRLILVVEPLDEPDGLILGQRLGGKRFVTLVNYTPERQGLTAIENVDGRNVGNPTTFEGNLFQKNRPSQVIVTVRQGSVMIAVDGRTAVAWKGTADQLSLSDYWKTPNEAALFVGAYDCRYRFHRLSLETISGKGIRLELPGSTQQNPTSSGPVR